MIPAEIAAIQARADAATPGPWRALEQGNQFVNTNYLPTAKVVAASRIEGLVRPWNPYRYIAFGFTPEEFETARFLDADATFIAAARADVPNLLAEVARLRVALERVEPILDRHAAAHDTNGEVECARMICMEALDG